MKSTTEGRHTILHSLTIAITLAAITSSSLFASAVALEKSSRKGRSLSSDNLIENCSTRLQTACTRLASGPAGILIRHPDGTVDINPLTLTRDWPPEYRPLLQPNHADLPHFQAHIRPMFLRLKEKLREQIEPMPQNSKVRRILLNRLQLMDIEVRDFDRCRRENRSPLIARFNSDENKIQICPLLSHARAISLATMLAHELGHAADLCDPAFPQPPETSNFPFTELHRCASRAAAAGGTLRPLGSPASCDRDSEIYADYISATLASLTFRPEDFPTDPLAATLEYDGFRLINTCTPHLGFEYFIPPILQNPLVRTIMACSGFEEETVCPGDSPILVPHPSQQ